MMVNNENEFIDTIVPMFKVNPKFKELLFIEFKYGGITGVHRKWKKRKIRKPETKIKIHLKGNNILYFYYRGYDIFHNKSYPFTGRYGDYSLDYCHYKYRDDYIFVHLQHKAITNLTKEEIYKNTLMFLKSIGIDLKMLEIDRKINRVDYKRDTECEYEPICEKQAIMSVCSKSRDSFYGVYKEPLKKGIGIKYKPKSSAAELIVYDKENETLNKAKKEKSSQTELEIRKYENVFRTELRAKSQRVHNNKKSYFKIDNTIDYYFNENIADDHFKHFVEPIFYTEPFYRIDYALLAIQSDRRLTEKEAEKLCELVTDINKKGYTRAKAEYNYCDDTFDKHIKLLGSIGINPLTFDVDIDIPFLLNFTTKEVCRDFTINDGEHEELKYKYYDEFGFTAE